jgi:hypothetical protein
MSMRKGTAIALFVLLSVLGVQAKDLVAPCRVIINNRSTVGQIAAWARVNVKNADADAAVMAKVNGYAVDTIAVDSGTVLNIPAKIDAIKAGSEGSLTIRKSIVAQLPQYYNEQSTPAERHPFIKQDYVRCQYTVTAADVKNRKTLAQLAKDFHSPAIRFSFFNPSMPVYTPLKRDFVIDVPDWDFTYWIYIGGSPVGRRAVEDLKANVWPKLRLFQQHPELIPVLEDMYVRDAYQISSVVSGERFDQWLSADRKTHKVFALDNGVNASDTTVGARRYDIDVPSEDSTAVIKLVDKCFNWVIKKIAKTRTKVVPTPPVPLFETGKKDTPDVDFNIPDDSSGHTVKQDTVVKSQVIPNWGTPPPVNTGIWKNRFLIYGDDFRPAYDATREGAQAYGFRWDCLKEHSNSRNSFGFTVQGNGWRGESKSGFTYDGCSINAGPMLILSLSPSVYWGIDLSVGGQWNWNHGVPSYDLEAFQTNIFGHLGSSFDAFWPYAHLSIWAGYDLAAIDPTPIMGGLKLAARDSRVGDVPQTLAEDPPIDNSGINFGTRVYVGTDTVVVKPCAVYRYAYSASDNSQTNAIGGGLSFFREGLILEGLFKNKSGSKYGADCNGNGFEATLTIAFGSGRSWFSRSAKSTEDALENF